MSKTASYAENAERDADQLVQQHLVLVKRIAHHISARLPANIEVDDLVQVGLIALLDAAGNYNAGLGASFETYASIRIRGAIIDELRRNDWVPRTVQVKVRQVAQAIHEVESQLQRPAKDTEIAEHLGVDLETYHDILRDTAACRLVDLDGEDVGDANDNDPHEALEGAGFKQDLAGKIAQLPEREKLVMALYYDEELNLKEIGKVLGVSESRVSQIHSQAVARLRAQLEPWTKPEPDGP
ncbi:MAG TPA: RNA polymerase sigma factor FliA [Porticoccaceae bacterium]|nr:RNA polymerase sigma factor FliA [Porticoccaceae bacterium]